MAWQSLAVEGDRNNVRVLFAKHPQIVGSIRGHGIRQITLARLVPARPFQPSEFEMNVATDGAFQYETVPDRYRVLLDQLDDDFYVRSIRFDETDVTHQAFDLPLAGGVLDIVVEPGAAGLSGSIHDAQGKTLPDAPVTIWATEKPSDGSPGFSMTTEADEEGDFEFSNLPPGSYRISAWQGIEKGVAEYPGFYHLFDSQAVPVTLSQAERKTLDLIAIPSATAEAHALKVR
jgi:hypothetical protein